MKHNTGIFKEQNKINVLNNDADLRICILELVSDIMYSWETVMSVIYDVPEP